VPSHPAGKPGKLRGEHLNVSRTPTLIVPGERDPFGTREEVARYALSKAVRVVWMPVGDHSFTPRKASGRAEGQNWEAAVGGVAAFVASRPGGREQR
jgi:uncharacterized protein